MSAHMHRPSVSALLGFLEHAQLKDHEIGNDYLLASVQQGDLDSVKKSIERGANINCRDGLGQTPLHLAAYHGHLDIIKFLFEQKVDYKIQSSDELTALQLAEEEEMHEASQYIRNLIIKAGGNPEECAFPRSPSINGRHSRNVSIDVSQPSNNRKSILSVKAGDNRPTSTRRSMYSTRGSLHSTTNNGFVFSTASLASPAISPMQMTQSLSSVTGFTPSPVHMGGTAINTNVDDTHSNVNVTSPRQTSSVSGTIRAARATQQFCTEDANGSLDEDLVQHQNSGGSSHHFGGTFEGIGQTNGHGNTLHVSSAKIKAVPSTNITSSTTSRLSQRTSVSPRQRIHMKERPADKAFNPLTPRVPTARQRTRMNDLKTSPRPTTVSSKSGLGKPTNRTNKPIPLSRPLKPSSALNGMSTTTTVPSTSVSTAIASSPNSPRLPPMQTNHDDTDMSNNTNGAKLPPKLDVKRDAQTIDQKAAQAALEAENVRLDKFDKVYPNWRKALVQAIEDPSTDTAPLSGRHIVELWLRVLSLDKYTNQCIDDGFDTLQRLCLLTEEDVSTWKNPSMPLAHKRHFLKAIDELKQQLENSSQINSTVGRSIGNPIVA